MQAFDKLTHVVDGERRIISDPPLIQPVEELFDGAEARPVHGVDTRACCAATGARCRATAVTCSRTSASPTWPARSSASAASAPGRGSCLMFGRDDNDPLFLQAKEAQASVLEEFVGPGRHTSHGARVVHGQHLMQETSDIFLGYEHVLGFDGVERDFYVRQLRDWKGAALVETMAPATMAIYGRVCGWTLARAHARSGDRVAIASYLGGSDAFDRAVAEFSETYADQNERDYDALVQADSGGRVSVRRGL